MDYYNKEGRAELKQGQLHIFDMLCKNWFGEVNIEVRFEVFIIPVFCCKRKMSTRINLL